MVVGVSDAADIETIQAGFFVFKKVVLQHARRGPDVGNAQVGSFTFFIPP